ncbi:MAG: hypothetical protein LBE22_00205 [Azoarcus sp.]|jgi:serine/threonine-protein kinase|nr:hypothetical protein [Azoarcus sp.]
MVTENPYATPATEVGDSTPDVPEEILRKIKASWTTAIFIGCINLLIATVLPGTVVSPFAYVAFFMLAFGIYKKSRICAVLMFACFIFSMIAIAIVAGRNLSDINLTLSAPLILLWGIFGYCLWQGVPGTFAYHKHKHKPPSASIGD